MNEQTQNREIAKRQLREALTTYKGDTQHPAVVAAIQTLAALNPTPSPARNESLRDGQWLLISAPNFPNREVRSDGKYVYTLGQLAFNMFQPSDLKVAIDRVLQPVLPIGQGQQRTHDIIVEFTTLDNSRPILQGTIYNFGICEPVKDDSLQVRFTGGALAPQSATNLKDWRSQFENQSRSTKTTLKEKGLRLLLGTLFGIIPPHGMDTETGKIAFTMQRSPKGNLTILYLDHELRITRGQKGTVLVCQRQS
jgi:hypothetical protein